MRGGWDYIRTYMSVGMYIRWDENINSFNAMSHLMGSRDINSALKELKPSSRQCFVLHCIKS